MNTTALKRILIIFFLLILLLFIGWLAYSFYLMKTSNGTHLTMFVDVQNQVIGKNVRTDFPQKEGSNLIYTFPVKIEGYTETDDSYTFTMSSNLYGKSKKNFEYTLEKNEYKVGERIKDLENSSVLLKLTYDLNQDLKYFMEYSVCTAKKIYSDIFKLDLSCGRGNCVVQRDVSSWEIQVSSKDIAQKNQYFNSYDKELLKKELLYFFMTDDFGYFDPASLRYSSVQLSRPDGSFSFGSAYISSAQDAQELSPVLFRFLSGVSNLVDSEENIDWAKYLSTLNGYINRDRMGNSYFLNCRTSSFTISNLKNCSSVECKEVKKTVLDYCKESLDSATQRYEQDSTTVGSSSDFSILQGYVFSIASEMIRFNRMADDVDATYPKYSEELILSYYQKGKSLLQNQDSVIAKCYSLDSAKEIYSQYPTDVIKSDMDNIAINIPDLSSFCDTNSSDPFCTASISEKLICADALIGYKTEEAVNLMSDIFYKNYFNSPGAVKIVTYENWRFSPFSEDNPNSLLKLDEYGYFTFVAEKDDVINHTADMGDSYYFVNLLNLLSND